jgi:hypothetical protein
MMHATIYERYSERPLLIFYAELPSDPDFRAESQAMLAKVAKIAHRHPTVKFVHADSNEESQATEMKDTYGIADQDQDLKAVFLDAEMKKYVMEDDGDLEEFVKQGVAGKLTPYVNLTLTLSLNRTQCEGRAKSVQARCRRGIASAQYRHTERALCSPFHC